MFTPHLKTFACFNYINNELIDHMTCSLPQLMSPCAQPVPRSPIWKTLTKMSTYLKDCPVTKHKVPNDA